MVLAPPMGMLEPRSRDTGSAGAIVTAVQTLAGRLSIDVLLQPASLGKGLKASLGAGKQVLSAPFVFRLHAVHAAIGTCDNKASNMAEHRFTVYKNTSTLSLRACRSAVTEEFHTCISPLQEGRHSGNDCVQSKLSAKQLHR